MSVKPPFQQTKTHEYTSPCNTPGQHT